MSAPSRIPSSSTFPIASSDPDSPSVSPVSNSLKDLIEELFVAGADSITITLPKEVNSMVRQNIPVSAFPSMDYKKMIEDVEGLLADSKPMTDRKLCRIYDNIFLFAGRTALTPGFCSICLDSGTLANSHIIPNTILSSLGNNNFISPRRPNEPLSAANSKWKLFCTPKCEVDRLSQFGENGFAQIFHKFIDDVIEARGKKKSASLITSDQSIHYCIASVIFRYIVVNGKRDIHPFIMKHGQGVEEAFWRFFFLLRSYVLDKDYPDRPHIQFFINEEELQKNTLITTLCTTYPNQHGECYTTGHFSFKGFHFLIVESLEFMKTHASDLTLPPHGFSETITYEPQTIVVRPEHLCVLPRSVTRALEFDAIVFQKMLQRVNGAFLAKQKASSADSSPNVCLPIHPLVDATKLYTQPPKIVRLPDDILFHLKAEKTGELIFVNQEKYEIVFSEVMPFSQIWLVRNKPAKQVFATIHDFSLNANVVYGFSLNQVLFEKMNFPVLQDAMESSDEYALKKLLGLIPLSRTDHLGIESIAKSLINVRLIAKSIKNFWSQSEVK